MHSGIVWLIISCECCSLDWVFAHNAISFARNLFMHWTSSFSSFLCLVLLLCFSVSLFSLSRHSFLLMAPKKSTPYTWSFSSFLCLILLLCFFVSLFSIFLSLVSFSWHLKSLFPLRTWSDDVVLLLLLLPLFLILWGSVMRRPEMTSTRTSLTRWFI